ncbi:MAG: HAD hydrolase family protein [Chthoniobacterales bacterium]
MSSSIRLISTDFDGTLICHPSDGTCGKDLAKVLQTFKSRGGIWAVNTGRSLAHAVEGLATFCAPVEPDFVLTLERDIHLPDGSGGWVPLEPWNTICRDRHAELFDSASGIFDRILEGVADSPDVTVIREEGCPVGLITTDEAAMDTVVGGLSALQRAHPEFSYQRNTIYLRFCHVEYHKGAALNELARHLGLETSEVFAVGDHFNDLSMMSESCAGSVACPANSIEEMKSIIRDRGGYVARRDGGEGTADALKERVLSSSCEGL